MAKEDEERVLPQTPPAEPVVQKKSKIVKRDANGAVEPFDSYSEERCLLCGQNRKTRGTDYCSKCLEKLKKKKPPVLGWFILLLFLAVTVVGFALGFMNYAPAKRIAEGKTALGQMRLNDAGDAYGEAFSLASELNSEIGHNIIMVGRETYADFAKTAGDPLSVALVAVRYLTEERIAADPELKAAVTQYKIYQGASDLVSGIVNDLEEGKMKPEDAVQALKKLEPQNEQYKMWLLYYESYAQVTYGKAGYEVQLQNLRELEKLYPDCGWFYNNMMRNCLYGMGRYEDCLVYCDREIADNRNAVDAYLAKLHIAMAGNKKTEAEQVIRDFEKYNDNAETVAVMKVSYQRVFGSLQTAIDLCNAALGDGSANVELNRQLAINYLAQNKYTEAYEAAYNAYSTAVNNYSQYGDSTALTTALFETVYVCTKVYHDIGDGSSQYDGDTEVILADFEGYEEQATALSLSILRGEADPAEALTKGTGDLI